VISEHIPNETLRDYLLRTLPEKDAEAIEERYFTDASFFHELRAAEMNLIVDYLDSRLDEREQELFERRYLRVDALRKRVEDVRARRTTVRRPVRRRLSPIALAGAVGCAVILAVAILRNNQAKMAPAPGKVASVEPFAMRISLALTPGVTKGTGSTNPVLTLPESPQPVFLMAALPGQVSSATYTARLLNVDLQGSGKKVWTANGIRSTPPTGAQQVILEVPSAAISPGDYILELEMDAGHVQETYVFRVQPSQKKDDRH
jgi:hypothetical protein